MGMGGAGVAVTRGAMSAYWNPAGLAPPKVPRLDTLFDVAIPIGVTGAAIGDVLADVDDVADLVDDLGDFDNLSTKLQDPGVLLNDEELQNTIRLLVEEVPDLDRDGVGLLTQANLGLAARYGNFAISALGTASAGGVTNVDFTNLALGDDGIGGVVGAGTDRSGQLSADGQTLADALAAQGLATQDQAEEVIFQAEQAGVSTADPGVQEDIESILQATQDNIGGDLSSIFTENGSGVNLRGILLQEYGVSYAYPIASLISIGVTTKLLYGTTFFEPFTLENIEDSGDLLEDAFDFENSDESLNYGIDVGILVQPLRWLSLGVVGRNLNRPAFDFEGPGDYVVEPQVRAGLGLSFPEIGLTVALDADLIENNSEALLDYDSQSVAGGVEFAILDTFMIRGGLSKNVSDSNEDIVLHGGLGFYLPGVAIEVSGMLSPEFTEVDGNDIPERAGAAIFVGINVPLD